MLLDTPFTAAGQSAESCLEHVRKFFVKNFNIVQYGYQDQIKILTNREANLASNDHTFGWMIIIKYRRHSLRILQIVLDYCLFQEVYDQGTDDVNETQHMAIAAKILLGLGFTDRQEWSAQQHRKDIQGWRAEQRQVLQQGDFRRWLTIAHHNPFGSHCQDKGEWPPVLIAMAPTRCCNT